MYLFADGDDEKEQTLFDTILHITQFDICNFPEMTIPPVDNMADDDHEEEDGKDKDTGCAVRRSLKKARFVR